MSIPSGVFTNPDLLEYWNLTRGGSKTKPKGKVQSPCKQSKGLLTLEKFQDCTYLVEPFVPRF